MTGFLNRIPSFRAVLRLRSGTSAIAAASCDPLGNPDWRMEGREMEEREKGCDGVEQAHKQGVSDRPRFGEIF